MARSPEDARRDRETQDLSRTVSKIASNDLPHIQSRLNGIDVRLARIDTNMDWATKLLIGLMLLWLSTSIGLLISAIR